MILKYYYTLLIALGITSVSIAQVAPPTAYPSSATVNYVRTYTATAPISDPAAITTRPMQDVKQSTQYFDGLGRLIQTVDKQASLETSSGTNVDIVSPVVYDMYGRETYKYLPYASTSSDGNFKLSPFQDQAAFYGGSTSYNPINGQGETHFYGQVNFEPSPLNRPQATMAPGNSWVGSNRGIQTNYWFNTPTDDVHIWAVSYSGTLGVFGTYSMVGNYGAGQLQKNAATDEAGHQVIEFKDKEGKVILKKVQLTATADNGTGSNNNGWLCTYYIYDDFNLLRAVIQPAGVTALPSNGWNITTTIANEQCFRYEYDNRHRVTMKQVPGTGAVYMVYDGRDRLVMTQDANLRLLNKWLVVVYDNTFNRPVQTGLLTDASGYTAISAAAANSSSYPNTAGGNFELLTQTHYDDYAWLPSGLTGSLSATGGWSSQFATTNNSSYPYPQYPVQNSAISTKGLVTWTQAEVVGTNSSNYQNSVIIYDERGRAIQNTTNSSFTGINTTNTTQYTWEGKPLATVEAQTNTVNNNQLSVISLFTYDILGRPINTQKRVGNSQLNNGVLSTPVTISNNQYDALGHLKNKFLGTKATGLGTYSNTPLETQQFDYNIRGWLLGLNRNYLWSSSTTNTSATQDATTISGESFTGPNSATFFGYEIGYDKASSDKTNISGGIGLSTVYANPQINGNISGFVWKTSNDIRLRKYDYTYDAANRLTGADFNQYTTGTFNRNANVNFSVSNISYDANGNVLSMKQMGLNPLASIGSAPIILDDLTYSYIGGNGVSNRLQQIVDASTTNSSSSTLGDFHYASGVASKTVAATTDYGYDANGNLISDANKQISGIVYNYLNLPSQVTQAKGVITYYYDANGIKLEKAVHDIATNTDIVTYNVGSMAYQSTTANPIKVLQFIAHEEGRIRLSAFDGSTPYCTYDYFLKDYLGNTRMTISDDYALSIPIQDVTHYYPFGLTMSGISSKAAGIAENKRKFNNGTELEHGEFSDGSGIELYSTDFRSYDPQIGRFHQIDPLADYFEDQSPYSFAYNNPISYNDPSGLSCAEPIHTQVLQEVVVTSVRHKQKSPLATPSEITNFLQMQGPKIFTQTSTPSFLAPVQIKPKQTKKEEKGGILDGFLDSQDKSNFGATSTLMGEAGLLEAGTEKLLRITLQGASKRADKIFTLTAIKGAARTGGVIGGLGILATIGEDYKRKQGITWGTGVKSVILGAGVVFPVFGAIYGVIDLGTGVITGKTLTDRIGDGVDEALK